MQRKKQLKPAEAPVANGNGHRNGASANIWVIAIAALGLFGSVANGFWSIANPRGDLTEIKRDVERLKKDVTDHYLTLREHDIYKGAVELRLGRVERDSVSFPLYDHAHKALEQQIERTAARVGTLEASVSTVYSPKDALGAIQARIDRLEGWFKDSRTGARPAATP